MDIHVSLKENSYDITIERGVMKKAGGLLNLDRNVLVVTDSGVPAEYSNIIALFCKNPVRVTIEQGEESKNFDNYKLLLETMLENDFTRFDCVAAVGGGVVGDLSGFAAATYMRGIDFYNIPTTVLSQVDSSVGGKTAIDFGHYKNTVGAFRQPKRVLIDPDVLKTLPKRQISNGLAESAKMAATFDEKLFSLFENGDIESNIDMIIARSVELKKDVVEKDEKEAGLRRVLNFGHTIGHAIESTVVPGTLYHGECVGIGMLAMSSDDVRKRIINVLNKLSLPVSADFDIDKACEAVLHDKKAVSGGARVIMCEKIGTFIEKKISNEELASLIRKTGEGEFI